MHDHFVIVGAQRCGTSYLTRLLDEHPAIEMAKPFRPEPKFFLEPEQYERGLEYYEETYFTDEHARVRGEKSTSYIESEVAIRRIDTLLPTATVVAVVRDPVRRAVSNHRFSTQHGAEHLPLAEGLRAAATGDRAWDPSAYSVSPFEYLGRGRYADYLERIAGLVPPERLHVLVFEELTHDPGVLARLYARLGVDPGFRPAGVGTSVNASAQPEALDPETEAWLRDYFDEPNRRLESLLGRSLPWPKAAGVR